MTAEGFRVGVDLGTLADDLRAASDTIEDLAAAAPAAPDAGPATAVLADMLATLVAAGANVSMDALEASDRLTETQEAYASVDARAAADLDLWED